MNRRLLPSPLVWLATLTCGLGTALSAEAQLRRSVPAKSVVMDLQAPVTTGRIVVKFNDESGLTALSSGLAAANPVAASRMAATLAAIAPSSRVLPRFQLTPEQLTRLREAGQARTGIQIPDLNRYIRLENAAPAHDVEALNRIVRALLADPAVETAFLEPVAVPAALGFDAFTGAEPSAFVPALAAVATPDFTSSQGYLEGDTLGVGANDVTAIPGSDGTGVQVIDVEGGWQWTHEDLPSPFATFGTQIPSVAWRNHGTAVLGEIRGSDNGVGIRGIAPGCAVGASSVGDQSVADAILNAATALNPGDIILIELHAPGPNANGTGQFGYVPMEYWQDNFDAILTVTAAGIIVCEAAGNGSQDLDLPVYQGLFDRNVRNSGAILCGASNGGSLSSASFSNNGTRLDLHGWGFTVTTTGYGDLQGGVEDGWYTSGFSGTSSASPIVVGAVASLQGMVKNAYGFPLDAELARDILVATGTPSTGPALIGPRPRLVDAWASASTGIGQIAGTVTENGSGTPLDGIDILVTETGTFLASATGGGYQVPLVAGAYNLSFSSFFHQTAILPATVTGGVITPLDAGLDLKPVVFIHGLVTGAGSPLSAARVTPLGVPLPPTASGGDGLYSIDEAPRNHEYTLLFDGVPGFGAELATLSALETQGAVANVNQALPPSFAPFEYPSYTSSDSTVWSYGTPSGTGGGPTSGFGNPQCWGVGMAGNYDDDAFGTVTSPPLNYAGAPVLFLSFHYWSETEANFDGVRVEVNDNIGSGWTFIEPLTGYTDALLDPLGTGGWSGSNGGWHGVVFDCSAFASGLFQFRLVFASDGGVNAPGFWFDDVAIRHTIPATTGIANPGWGVFRPSLAARPNPLRSGTTLSWSTTTAGHFKLEVFDLRGARVRTLWDGPAAERGSVTWDGRDNAGRSLAAGVYFARALAQSGESTTQRLVITP